MSYVLLSCAYLKWRNSFRINNALVIVQYTLVRLNTGGGAERGKILKCVWVGGGVGVERWWLEIEVVVNLFFADCGSKFLSFNEVFNIDQ